MKRKNSILLHQILLPILIILSQTLCAQEFDFEHDIFGATKLLEQIYRNSGRTGTYLEYDALEGSPFLHDKFIKGEILTTDSTLYADIDLRYDAYKESMQFRHKDQIFILGNDLNIKHIKIQDQYFHKIYYVDNDKVRTAYFRNLAEGSCSLYMRYKVKFIEAEEAKGYNQPKPARFGPVISSYYINSEDDRSPIPLKNKKQLLEYLNDDGAISEMIKKEKLKFSDEEDLIKIVQYYNSSKI